VEASQAGQEIRCRCGAPLEVPTMRGLAELARAGPESGGDKSTPAVQTPSTPEAARSPQKPAPLRPTSAWGPRQRLGLIGAVIVVLGLLLGATFPLLRPRMIEAEQLSPIAAWRIWRDLRHGIEQPPPWEEMYFHSLAVHRRWMVVASVLTGVGVLVMASSLLVSRRRPSRTKSVRRRKRP